MTAHDIIAGRLAYIECGVSDPQYVSDGNRVDAADIVRSLEAAGFRVVPADLVDGMRGIAARRCLSDGPCANHTHPQCRGGSCVTCQARAHVAHLDGDDPLGVFAGNP